MFVNSDKRRLYWLIIEYLNQHISARTFCDEFYYCYDLAIDYDTLTQQEKDGFSSLSEITGRFSEFENDIRKYPGTYYTEQQLRQKVTETKEALNAKDFLF
ncbi:colicin immunity domain-containing protein [Dinghuibacter silviterrae]|uniref:Self-protective colicin-like immunity protein n=1 Tax=Dinghuibacter silviterrae TaxID=1539049 RepID=A0A4R8DBZ4_9BACT|nr:colicin immunity domain-containing protein [Dinghuibacter silviterrae]TDW91897.1 self-protective colicin-like immunity protein [Dinghuibacter silviterrae]